MLQYIYILCVQDHIDGILKHKPMLDELNQRARELDKKAALPSQTAIEQTTRNINERVECSNHTGGYFKLIHKLRYLCDL